jgi:hypothetical protein
LLDQVIDVLDLYSTYLPLTLRQIFYRLVAAYAYSKTEGGYKLLSYYLNRARRAGLIPWEHIRDDQVIIERPGGFDGTASFWNTVRYWAHAYTRDVTEGGSVAVELWVEAAGMVPQLGRIARPYGVSVVSSGGFNGVGMKHEAVRRFIERDEEDGRSTVVLHVGDYDPSGCALIDSLADDIGQFCVDYGNPGIVEFRRVAVTPEQIGRYDLPTAPQKEHIRIGEHMPETVQAEALTPDQLASEVRQAIEAAVDLEAIEALRAQELDERFILIDQIEEAMGRLSE